MDVFESGKRSQIMRAIKSADTKPEIFVRKLLHASGFRYSLRSTKLPGKPDIVLTKWRTVVFVNGCFWHQHQGCPRATLPGTRQDYWLPKLAQNALRDAEEREQLRQTGWRVLVVWECACLAKCRDQLQQMLTDFLRGTVQSAEIGRNWDININGYELCCRSLGD